MCQLKRIIKEFPGSYTTLNYYRKIKYTYNTYSLINKKFVYHEPCYVLKPYLGPKICTIHDLSHIHYPESHPKERVKFLLRYLPTTINTADHIITGSEFIRQELINLCNVSSDKVTTIHHGISKVFKVRSVNQFNFVLSRYGLNGKTYLLSVGTLEPRKNLERLIYAFKKLPEHQRVKFPLVIVGVQGWKTCHLKKLVQSLIIKGQIYILGYVIEYDLPYLYSGAYGFIYLSIYEGFGFPILEALASGIPTLASNISSIPEIVDNSAILCNPFNVDEITIKIKYLLDDINWREKLKISGPKQAEKFSLSTFIEKTIDVYRKISVL